MVGLRLRGPFSYADSPVMGMTKTATATSIAKSDRPLRLVAIDPAATSGVAVGAVNESPTLSVIRFRKPGDNHVESYGRVAHWALNLFSSREFDALAIEVPIAAWGESHYKTLAWAHAIYGIITGIAQTNGMLVMPVAVSTWRKSFLGAGNLPATAAKAAALRHCEMLHWQTHDSMDAAEAGGIWHWARGELQVLEWKELATHA